jgi:GNAT superfamily N-acetyltransferase
METTIRKATKADLEVLILFQRAMAEETESIELDSEIVRQGIDALFDDPSKGKYIVIGLDGVLAGCLMLTYEWSDWRNGTVLWIQSVYIEPQHRGKGLYKLLYNFVKNEVSSDNSIKGIRLYVDKRNTTAQKVYETLGMNGEHYQVYEWME